MDKTKIEWTDATWNPVRGCTKVSAGCANCYAEKTAARFSDPGQWGHGIATRGNGGRWTGKIAFDENALTKPLKWKKPRKIFVTSVSDPFHQSVPDEWLDRIFAVMALTPHHTYQLLTKRPERMREYIRCRGPHLPNLWLGVSVENDHSLHRLDILRKTPATLRFISFEPLIGPLSNVDLKGIGWVICGGESGAAARPMHPDWVRSLRDQCAATKTPFFFKQWGEWVPQVGAVDGWNIPDNPEASRYPHCDWEDGLWGRPYYPVWCDDLDDDTMSRVGKTRAGHLLDGREHREFPK